MSAHSLGICPRFADVNIYRFAPVAASVAESIRAALDSEILDHYGNLTSKFV
jgi:hypothetical protein